MNISLLEAAGIDYADGVHRFMGDAGMYEKFLKMFFNRQKLDELTDAMDKKDYKQAFAAVHELKGSSGNLSINGVYKAAAKLCEELKEGVPDRKAGDMLEMLLQQYDNARAAVEAAGK